MNAMNFNAITAVPAGTGSWGSIYGRISTGILYYWNGSAFLTLATTSDLGSYLPLIGGTMTGANPVTFAALPGAGYSIRGANAVVAGNGVAIKFTSGNGFGAGLGGVFTITTGDGGATGNSGTLSLSTGSGGATSGGSGDIAVATGDANPLAADGTSGTIGIQTGAPTGAGVSGDIAFQTGTAIDGNSGAIDMNTGDSANGNTGTITFATGDSTTAAAGDIDFEAGAGAGVSDGYINLRVTGGDGRIRHRSAASGTIFETVADGTVGVLSAVAASGVANNRPMGVVTYGPAAGGETSVTVPNSLSTADSIVFTTMLLQPASGATVANVAVSVPGTITINFSGAGLVLGDTLRIGYIVFNPSV